MIIKSVTQINRAVAVPPATVAPTGPQGPMPFAVPVAYAAGINAVILPPATAVVHEGSLYIATVAHTTTASFDEAKWMKLASKGDAGQDNNFLSVAGKTPDAEGNVDLVVADIDGAAPLISPAFVGAPTAPTTTVDNDSIQIATTAFVQDVRALLQEISERNQVDGYAGLDSTGKVPTSLLPSAVLGNVSYQGAWNASTDTPSFGAASSANKGHYYRVSVAGTTNKDGITDWQIGDWIISNGTVWEKIDNTDLVTSVAGRQGAVTLTLADIAAGAAPAGAMNFTASTVTAATQAKADNSTLVATTAHVKLVAADYAPLASPTFTGTPAAPTAAAATNTTQIATTAMVQAAISASIPTSSATVAQMRAGVATGVFADPVTHVAAHKPAFHGTRPSWGVTANTDTAFTGLIETFDSDTAYNGTSFTPLVAGWYLIGGSFYVPTLGGMRGIKLYVNGAEYAAHLIASAGSAQTDAFNISSFIFFNGTTDNVQLVGRSDFTPGGNITTIKFWGFRLFA